MKEEQGEIIIKLLEKMNSKLDNIEHNTDQLRNLTCDVWVLDDIKKLLENR